MFLCTLRSDTYFCVVQNGPGITHFADWWAMVAAAGEIEHGFNVSSLACDFLDFVRSWHIVSV